MWLLRPFDDILSSAVKVALLRVLCDAGSPLSGREVVRRAGVSYGPGWAALQELVRSGVLSKRDLGRASAYELRAPAGPLMAALDGLFTAERERAEAFVGALTRALPEALSMILYGSEARGEAAPGSDTDVLIVVERRTEELAERIDAACVALAGDHGLALSWHIADLAELRAWEAEGSDFWRKVLRDGIRLAGDTPERLRRRWQTGRAS